MESLNVVVCIKPVPDPRRWNRITLDPKTGSLRREGIPIIINPLDEHAIEEALRMKEGLGGQVTVISMGPRDTTKILTLALAMGADEAVLLTDMAFAGADTLATAYVLAMGIKKLGKSDVIVLGNESLDGSTGQVAPQVAEFLGLPQITNVDKVELSRDGIVRARSKIEFGYRVMESKMPVVLAVMKDINEPRIPSLVGLPSAAEKKIRVWSVDDIGADRARIGLQGSPTRVKDIFTLEIKRRCEILQGDPAKVTEQLARKLRIEGVAPKV